MIRAHFHQVLYHRLRRTSDAVPIHSEVKGYRNRTVIEGFAMTKIPKGFEQLMSHFGFCFAVIGDIETGEKTSIGNRSALAMDFIVRNTFDSLSVSDLDACYKDRLMPAMVQQGDVCGIICKPAEGIVVGLFANDRRAVMDRVESNEMADKDLRTLWRSNDGANH